MSVRLFRVDTGHVAMVRVRQMIQVILLHRSSEVRCTLEPLANATAGWRQKQGTTSDSQENSTYPLSASLCNTRAGTGNYQQSGLERCRSARVPTGVTCLRSHLLPLVPGCTSCDGCQQVLFPLEVSRNGDCETGPV